jgi:deoxycytidylate deaminase
MPKNLQKPPQKPRASSQGRGKPTTGAKAGASNSSARRKPRKPLVQKGSAPKQFKAVKKAKKESPTPPKPDHTFPTTIIGLISPVGINKKNIIETITEVLGGLNCEAKIIKITEILKNIPRYKELNTISPEQEDRRIKIFMDAGDHLRKHANSMAFSFLAIREIKKDRELHPDRRIVYIIDSLKNPSEIKLLKHVYTNRFLPIAFNLDRESRLSNLMKKIAGAHYVENEKHYRHTADKLIDRDEDGGTLTGQNIRDAFPLADVFVNCEGNFKPAVERALKTWFGNSFITPNREEVGMFIASAIALRSSDLSRQVGAVIIDKDGTILATGCNESPSISGGVTWDGDPVDIRDFNEGYDTNYRFKQSSIGEIVDALIQHKWLRDDLGTKNKEELVKKVEKDHVFKGTRITNLIEFGKIVHAEMAAITEAARRGSSIDGSTLICTTYPCHMCARHIIASGIKRVVYIEPYPKSLSTLLYGKLISHTSETDKIHFSSFEGVGPNRFRDFFTMNERKNSQGIKIDWNPKTSKLKGHVVFNFTELLENSIDRILEDEKQEYGFLVGKKDPNKWKMEVEK